ncbi:MAG: hypothetical protein C7B46_04830 [Sulfobacillus benefaciens]|uniref:ChsH2 C-terminal OB-fold domain-containing protein n=1 Tax=Sulfobacillus benefaciens TaxID=453960 RepID=A0A2T2XJ01_9FIRM|nr:MAG: hypothetical protein C7B46_04830 [Sulfobacillus benefaciens]
MNYVLYACQRCHKISAVAEGAPFHCWACQSTEGTMIENVSGTVESFTVLHVAPLHYLDDIPYGVATVLLNNQVRVVGRLSRFTDLDRVTIGTVVHISPDERYGLVLHPLDAR